MADSTEQPETLIERIAATLRETGPLGLVRKAARIGAGRATKALERAERQLFYAEAVRRLPAGQRAAGLETARALRGRHRGQPAFIIGTGPSIRDVPLERLEKVPSFGVNSLFLHPAFERWSPTYYCLMDDHFFMTTEEGADFRLRCSSRVGAKTEFIVPAKHLHCSGELGFPSGRTWFVPMDGKLTDDVVPLFEPERIVANPPNVVLFGLMMALLTEASPIILLGAEHSWLAERAGIDPVKPHFHAERLAVTKPNAVVAPWNPFNTYLRTMRYCTEVWECYEVLARHAQARGLEIFNATPGSYLDVFPEMTTEQALSLVR